MKRTLALMLALLPAFAACRGGISEKPPVHIVWDMDFQQKIEAQEAFAFPGWADKRGMRLPVAGTIPRGTIQNRALEVFKDAVGNYVGNNPLPASLANFERGQERFNIYCAVCHDRTGGGQGLVLQRAPIGSFSAAVPHLATEPRLRPDTMADGQLYETITNGKGTMPAYGHMIPVEDRWCIVHYLRALQNRIKS